MAEEISRARIDVTTEKRAEYHAKLDQMLDKGIAAVRADDEEVALVTAAPSDESPAPTLKQTLAAAAAKRERPQFSVNQVTNEIIVVGTDGESVTWTLDQFKAAVRNILRIVSGDEPVDLPPMSEVMQRRRQQQIAESRRVNSSSI